MGTATRATVTPAPLGRSWAGCLGCLGLGLGLFLLAPPVRSQNGDVESLLNEGYNSYLAGELEAARDAFEKALSQKPSSDVLFQWVEKTQEAQLFRMALSDDPRISGMAIEILNGAREHRRERTGDAEVIRRAVADVMSSDGEEQILKMIRYSIDMGRNLVPEIIPVLGDAEIERRTVGLVWIASHIGRDAIPPLTAAWKHPDQRIRINIAKLLGMRDLRHSYSAAYLKAIMETDEVPDVREEARASFDAILDAYGESGGESASAAARLRFLRNARLLYLRPHINPFDNSAYAPRIYRLEGDTVVSEDVARFQLSERMAQQNLEEALKLDPEYGLAHVLNLLNDSAQVIEYEENVDWYESQDGFEDVKAILASQEPYVDTVLRLRTLQAPSDVVYAALEQALKDGRSSEARYLIGTIRDRKLRGRIPEALIQALDDPASRLVRIAAAIALAEWSPREDFGAGERVVATLESAILQGGIRTVVKAMGNQDYANRFERVLEQLAMESYFHLDSVAAAYASITSLPPDLVLVDDQLKLDVDREKIGSVSVFINNLRRNYRTAELPVVLVVDPARLDKAKEIYENEERKVWVVPSNVEPRTFKEGIVEPLFADRDDAKALATKLAAEAARALEGLVAASNPLFPINRAIESLGRALDRRPDEVRIPCIRALGGLGAVSQTGVLAQTYALPDNAPEVREEAMLAVGRILATTPSPPPAAVADIIVQGTQSSDLPLRRAAWMAFADAGLEAETRLELLLSRAAEGAGGVGIPPEGEAGAGEEEPAEAEDSDTGDDLGFGDGDEGL